MIYSSLAVVALSASAVVSPFTNHIHMHPRQPQSDFRVSLKVHNNAISFRDIKIGGQVYTVKSHQSLDIKAPAGTVIYADSHMASHPSGDTIVEVMPTLEHQTVNID